MNHVLFLIITSLFFLFNKKAINKFFLDKSRSSLGSAFAGQPLIFHVSPQPSGECEPCPRGDGSRWGGVFVYRLGGHFTSFKTFGGLWRGLEARGSIVL